MGTGNGNGKVHVELLLPAGEAPIDQLAALVEAIEEHQITQDAVAALFEERCGERVLYDWQAGRGVEWKVSVWRKYEWRLTVEAVRQTCRAASAGSKGRRQREARSAGFIAGVERLCRSARGFAIVANEWNRDSM